MSDPNVILDEGVLNKTKLVLAVRDYHIEKKQSKEKRIDFTFTA